MCRFGVRGPLLERVPVHAPQCRGHAFILKNACASFEKNRKSVTKSQKAPDLGLLKRDNAYAGGLVNLGNFLQLFLCVFCQKLFPKTFSLLAKRSKKFAQKRSFSRLEVW